MPSRLSDETRGFVAEAYGVVGYNDRRIPQTLFPRQLASGNRRKVEGLNSRYDRMIETVNVINSPDVELERKRRRRNSSTSGSSSLASWDTPKTPLDMTSNLDGHARTESLSKPQYSSRNDMEKRKMSRYLDQYFCSPTQAADNTPDEVPSWLSDTVATLQVNHPLRDLIPAPPTHISSRNIDKDQTRPNRSHSRVTLPDSIDPAVEDVFAFRPPTAAEAISKHAYINTDSIPTERLPQSAIFAESTALRPPSHASNVDIIPQLGSPYSPRPARLRTGSANLRMVNETTPLSDCLGDQMDFYSQYPDEVTRAPDYDANIQNQLDIPFSRPGPLATHSTLPSCDLTTSSTISFDHDAPRDVKEHDTLPYSTPGPLAASNPPLAGVRRQSIESSTCHTSLSNPSTIGQPMFHTVIASSPCRSLDDSFVEDTPLATHGLSFLPGVPRSSLRADSLLAPSANATHGNLDSSPSTHVYFDSPVEDPMNSDPLEPSDYELDLDYEGLDFCWSKFDRSGPSFHQAEPFMASSELVDTAPSEEPNPFLTSSSPNIRFAGAHLPNFRSSSKASSPCTLGPQRRASPAVEDIQSHSEASSSLRMPSVERKPMTRNVANEAPTIGPPFAPAPGIYISPIRYPEQRGSSQDMLGSDTKNDGRDEEILDFSLPRTPVGESSVVTSQHITGGRMCSSPPNVADPGETVLDVQTTELMERSRYSQESNDTIESWSEP
ncbi:hypothetical protein PHLGIDRAFT_114470 [Phlebiopsis gigantea 11061_1 CR5-6]|uniref:Uncharacterized protein n=1 Tax=Phlebiopsis gigantea (strain 11061_1 CR5-6) TaxID=745531 RepID=A0A0C3P1C5_PHLG1|nr:hypothetical protein PHLGIDRAFT_114470 [Phlebiopsis gigantea 11061_1 CR5-6]